MNYYEYLLPNTNEGLRRIKRIFLIVASVHFVSGLALMIVALIIHWVFVFAPLVWFLLGFVYGNIAYLFVTDYKYVYDNGTLHIYKHRKYGRYVSVTAVPVADIEWDGMYEKTLRCTNCPENMRFVYQNVQYIVTVDDYMQTLVKGDHHVS